MRTPLIVIGVLVAAAIARCVSVIDRLPPQLVSHFDSGGRANGSMPLGAFFQFYALTGGGTVLLLLALPWLVRALPPSLINIPNREYWLVPDRRADVHAKMAVFGAWSAAATAALLVVVLELVLRANLAHARLASGPMWLVIVLFMLGTLGSLVWLARAFRIPS
jgi:hypothetical protein